MIPPDPTVEAAINQLQLEVAELRQLSILNEVETYLIPRSQVRPILNNYYFSMEGTEDEIEDNRLVLVALGLIEPDYDLETNDSTEKISYAYLANEFAMSVTQITNALSFVRNELRRIVLEKLRELTIDEREYHEEVRWILGIEPE